MAEGHTGSDTGELTEDADDVLHVREDYPTRPVPNEERRSWFATLTVWAGWTISITAFLVGGLVGGGLPLADAIPAVFIGNIVLAIVGAMIGYLGMKSGLSTYVLAQGVFGRYGSILISIFIGIFAMGFVGVFAGATGNFLNGQFGTIPVWGGALVFTALVVATAIYGFVGLEYLSRVAVPGLWILAIWALFSVGGEIEGGLSAVWAIAPADPKAFSFGVTLAISTWITGASITADIGRYAKNKWHVIIGAFGGWVFGAAFLESISAVSALGVGNGDLVEVMIEIGLFWPALFVFLAAMWTSADNNLYSFSLAFTSLSDVLGQRDFFSKEVWVVIGGVLVFIGAAAGLYSQFTDFLLTIAITVPPMAGIFISKYYILGEYKKSGDEMFKEIQNTDVAVSYVAFITWIISSTFAYFADQGALGLPAFVQQSSPAVNALILSAVLYAILYKIAPDQYR